MFKFIKKFIEERKRKREEFKKDLLLFVRIFDCGERIWRKITELERRKIFVEQFYNGSHTVGSDMAVNLHWKEFDVSLERVSLSEWFGYGAHPLFKNTGIILSKKYGDDTIRHQIWELRFFRNGISVTGIERLEGLTDLFIKDMDALASPDTQDGVNAYADGFLKQRKRNRRRRGAKRRQSSEIRQKSSNGGKSN